jgi:hypothetical protein
MLRMPAVADSYQTNGEVLQDFLKDALNNSFPGVLRLGYFSDGANLS